MGPGDEVMRIHVARTPRYGAGRCSFPKTRPGWMSCAAKSWRFHTASANDQVDALAAHGLGRGLADSEWSVRPMSLKILWRIAPPIIPPPMERRTFDWTSSAREALLWAVGPAQCKTAGKSKGSPRGSRGFGWCERRHRAGAQDGDAVMARTPKTKSKAVAPADTRHPRHRRDRARKLPRSSRF